MAKVLFTAIVADMRRKLNGTVFSKNRYGSMVRTKVSPRQPRTQAQTTARGVFSSFSNGYKSLTEAQRQAWIAFAATINSYDVFKQKRVLTGQAAYIRVNTLLQSAGLTAVVDAPDESSVDTAFKVDAAQIVATGSIDIVLANPDDSPLPSNPDELVLVDASPAVSAGINNRSHGFYRIMNAPQDGGLIDITDAWTGKFGAIPETGAIFVRTRLINVNTGAVSPSVIAKVLLSPTIPPDEGDALSVKKASKSTKKA